MGFLKKLKDTTEKSVEKGTELSKKGIEKSAELGTKGYHGAKQVATSESVKEQFGSLKKEALRLKKVWQSKDVIQLKTDEIAVLLKKMGKEDEFFVAFSELTKEGYRMVLREEVRDIPVASGISFQLGVYYYFQHSKYIT